MRTARTRSPAPDDQDRIEHARLWLPLGRGSAAAGLPAATARALDLAAECGAAVAPVMAAASAVAAERAATRAALEQVVRPAVGIARGLVALPLVLVPVLALVLDIDLWEFWTADPLGQVVALVVMVMVLAAASWLRFLVVVATRPDVGAPERGGSRIARSGAVVGAVVLTAVVLTAVVGWWAGVGAAVGGWWLTRRGDPGPLPGLDEVADLAAIAVESGHDLCGALRRAAARVPDVALGDAVALVALRLALSPPRDPAAPGLPLVPTPGPVPDPAVAPLERLVVDLFLTGQPAADPLRRLARRLRRVEAERVRVAVARLPGRLTFPTALLLVPATVLAIGTPIAMRGLQAVSGS
jgi:hypothetical protein